LIEVMLPDSRRPGRETTRTAFGSLVFIAAISAGCSDQGLGPRASGLGPSPEIAATNTEIKPDQAEARRPTPTAPAAAPEACLGVADTGIWSDLDDQVQIVLPADLDPARVTARVDAARNLLVLAVDGVPTKPYPLAGDATLALGDRRFDVRPGDAAELARLLVADRVTDGAAADDVDKDGLSDALDIFIGAKKTAVNAAAYGAGYISIEYPMGDVPREVGVCTDVIIRAMRNAGIDLQAEVHRDIGRARAAYGRTIKGKGDTNIDHRRVRTILPWFKRHWDARAIALDDAADPYRPGDVIFMDTFPSKSGPDHIGIVSDTIGESGHPLVINNWTDGYHTQEMDLLGFVPVTHRFRVK
jgi:uncharacterized protein YijF (DUF1287 family)